jgi:hypothetical protein
MSKDSLIERIYLQGGFGIRITRAPAADPQAVFQSIFQITGLVAVTSLVGVRSIAQAGGASTMQFEHSVGPTILDLGTLSVAADTIGTIYCLDGDVGDAITKGLGGILIPGNVIDALSTKFIVGAGTIDVTMTAAGGTGSTGYSITYIPLEDSATIYAL